MPLRLALIPILFFSSPGREVGSRTLDHRVGAWTVRVSVDRFSDQVTCRLFARGVDYRRGALVFHLSRRTDTSAAVYRVDGGAPIAARSEVMDMARAGFAVYRDDLDNPSGGLVRIPERRVMEARSVQIRPGSHGAAATFKVEGFSAALGAARAAGCGPGSFDGSDPPWR